MQMQSESDFRIILASLLLRKPIYNKKLKLPTCILHRAILVILIMRCARKVKLVFIVSTVLR